MEEDAIRRNDELALLRALALSFAVTLARHGARARPDPDLAGGAALDRLAEAVLEQLCAVAERTSGSSASQPGTAQRRCTRVGRALEAAASNGRDASRPTGGFAVPPLTATLAEDFRTPLSAIIGFAELLFDRSLDAESRSWIETISTQAARLAALVDELARLEALGPLRP